MLDVGCGEGRLVVALLSAGVDCRGTDCADTLIARCNALAPGRFRQGDILALPFPDNFCATLLCLDTLQHLRDEDIPTALRELRRVSARNIFLKISTCPSSKGRHRAVHPRLWWEKACLEAGLSFHPRELYCVPYEARDFQPEYCTIILEKIPDAVLAAFPLSSLKAERNLHMDMLREAGRRGEAHRQRYYAAAGEIRFRDVVLDLACGLGYGAHILYHNSQAARVMGVDSSPFAVRYATARYALEGRMDFRLGNAEDLSFLPDNSIDYVAGFETIEHLENPERYLRELFRVLRPAGRVMLSAPDRWVNERGLDPNPYHLQVYSWERLKKELDALFLPEKYFEQYAGSDYPESARFWRERETRLPPPEKTEWVIAQSMKDPLENEDAPYTERAHIVPADWKFHDAGFAAKYRNPWLQDALLRRDTRLRAPRGLKLLARRTLRKYPPDSPDHALALCVLAYKELEQTPSGPPLELVASIESWLESKAESAAPVDARWKISLAYVLALLRLRQGEQDKAAEAFRLCWSVDPLLYSPTLGTKTVGARFQAALLALGGGKKAEARELLRQALAEVWRVFAEGGAACMGGLDHPLWWNVLEMRQILDIGQQCLILLHEFSALEDRPGLVHCADPCHTHIPRPNISRLRLETLFRAQGARLEGKEVYFWGCGQFYDLHKNLFALCRPRCILLDLNPEGITEKDGLAVRHPEEVLPRGEKLPIVVFAWHPEAILRTIENNYPQYAADDIVYCVSPA
jgi:ubiquinone/menaquinone biosynthesis C-methylase UbiE